MIEKYDVRNIVRLYRGGYSIRNLSDTGIYFQCSTEELIKGIDIPVYLFTRLVNALRLYSLKSGNIIYTFPMGSGFGYRNDYAEYKGATGAFNFLNRRNEQFAKVEIKGEKFIGGMGCLIDMSTKEVLTQPYLHVQMNEDKVHFKIRDFKMIFSPNVFLKKNILSNKVNEVFKLFINPENSPYFINELSSSILRIVEDTHSIIPDLYLADGVHVEVKPIAPFTEIKMTSAELEEMNNFCKKMADSSANCVDNYL